MKKDISDTAFPCTSPLSSAGMTLRDYFAGQALAGLCSAQDAHGTWQGAITETAEKAYQIADWMIEERRKESLDA